MVQIGNSPATLLVMTNSFGGSGAVAIAEVEMVRVCGDDAGRFLQGQLSQDVMAMPSPVMPSFLLAPSGKVVAWVQVHRVDDTDFTLFVEPSFGAVVKARLQRFLLRTKAEISDPQTATRLSFRSDGSRAQVGLDFGESAVVATAVGPGVFGFDVYYPSARPQCQAQIDELCRQLEVEEVTLEEFERFRIAHAIPANGKELTEETIPGEVGDWVISESVSFTKGCYTGQELVARIDSRGNNVPHPIRLVTIDNANNDQISVGDVVLRDGNEVGTVTSWTPALADAPALALVRVGRAISEGDELTIGSAKAVVVNAPV